MQARREGTGGQNYIYSYSLTSLKVASIVVKMKGKLSLILNNTHKNGFKFIFVEFEKLFKHRPYQS